MNLPLYLMFLAVISCANAYKILMVYPFPAKSHSILGDGIVKHLLNDGHEVTYISPFPYKPASPNLRVVDVSDNIKTTSDDAVSINAFIEKKSILSEDILLHMVLSVMKMTVENDDVQRLLNDPKEHFDVVVTEWMFSEIPASYAAVFNCPLIWSSAVDAHWPILRLIDQTSSPPYAIASSHSPLLQRVSEFYTQLKARYFKFTHADVLEKKVYDELFAPIIVRRGRQPPSFNDLKFNASLILANAHVSIGQAIATPRNWIPVGGYYIEEDTKPLPGDLKKIMDESKNGVIYFSMGSNLKSKDIPKELKDSLLTMFGELKQTVLWKLEEDLPNKPKNVRVLTWAPQQKILSHNNTVVFITHGGLLSTTETIHFGVPIIGIPVYGDQFSNIDNAVQRGYALKVDLSYTMADELKAAIEEIVTNPRYTQKVKELSFIYHNRLISPGEELKYWVKHVIDTRGAPHLRPPKDQVPIYQKFYLDVIVFVFGIVFLTLSLVKNAVSVLFFSSVASKRKID